MVIGFVLIGVIGVGSIAAIIGAIVTDREDGAPRASARHTPVDVP
jgi:hypothetical protein